MEDSANAALWPSLQRPAGFWPQAHSRLQSDGRSTTDTVAGDPRTNGRLHQSNYCDAHERLGSVSKSPCVGLGVRACIACAFPLHSDNKAGASNDRTAQVFPERKLGADALASRAGIEKPSQSDK